MATGVRALLDQLPDDGRGLAISHTPLVERAAFGLTGREFAPMRECEGMLITRADDGTIDVRGAPETGRVSEPATSFVPALAFGFALGIAPGPVQVLILSQSAKRGLAGGLRVMLGANLTLFAILLALALGLSGDRAERHRAPDPRCGRRRGADRVRRARPPVDPPAGPRGSGRGRRFARTDGDGRGGRRAEPRGLAVLRDDRHRHARGGDRSRGGAAPRWSPRPRWRSVSSFADLVSTGLGSGGHRVLGPRGLAALRTVLGMLLVVIGIGFVARGVTGSV